MLKKFITFCSTFFFNYIFFTDQPQTHCTPGPNSLTTRVTPHIVTEVLGQQTTKYYKDVFGKPIVSSEDFLRRNIKFSIDHTCDLKSKTIIVGANTMNFPKQDASVLFKSLQTHSPISFNNNITIVGKERVFLSTLTEQYAVYNPFTKYNLKGFIYTNTAKMVLTPQEYMTVNQPHPDCSFFRHPTEDIVYYDVKQKPLELKSINNIIPITFMDNEQISGTTHYTNMEMYLNEKFKIYNAILENGSYSDNTRELFDSFKSSGHLSYVERLDLSNRLTLSLLHENKNFSGEIACILEPSNTPQEEFKGNFDSFWKNYRENLPSPSESEKNAIVFRQFIQDNLSELLPLIKQQEKIYWPPFIDTLL